MVRDIWDTRDVKISVRLLCISDPAFQLLSSDCADVLTKLIELFGLGDYLDGKKCSSFDVCRWTKLCELS